MDDRRVRAGHAPVVEEPAYRDRAVAAFIGALDQVDEALAFLDLDADAFLHFPYRDLDALVGGIGPGTVGFLCAFSGGGKTTFTGSLVERWREHGKTQYIMPLETKPKTFRVYWACQKLGFHPGEILSGDYLRRPDHAEVRAAIKQELVWQSMPAQAKRVLVSSTDFVTADGLCDAVEEAKDCGCDVVIVDHIDHIEGGDGGNLYAESARVNKLALKLAQHHDLHLLFTSQLNLEALRGGDALAQYQPPRPNHVFLGNEKRKVATYMLGLFRPLREQGPDESFKEYTDAVKAARTGGADVDTVLERGAMGVVQMKSRNGKPEGRKIKLGVRDGRVVDYERLPYHMRTPR